MPNFACNIALFLVFFFNNFLSVSTEICFYLQIFTDLTAACFVLLSTRPVVVKTDVASVHKSIFF